MPSSCHPRETTIFKLLDRTGMPVSHPSMGYTAVGTLLGGAFVGMAGQRSREVESRWQGARNGGLIWVMDIGLFAPAGEFRQGVDEMVRLAREELIPDGSLCGISKRFRFLQDSRPRTLSKAVRIIDRLFESIRW